MAVRPCFPHRPAVNPGRLGGDNAESGIPSPLGTIHASCYSTAMTSRHNAVLSVLGENEYHGRRSLIGMCTSGESA